MPVSVASTQTTERRPGQRRSSSAWYNGTKTNAEFSRKAMRDESDVRSRSSSAAMVAIKMPPSSRPRRTALQPAKKILFQKIGAKSAKAITKRTDSRFSGVMRRKTIFDSRKDPERATITAARRSSACVLFSCAGFSSRVTLIPPPFRDGTSIGDFYP